MVIIKFEKNCFISIKKKTLASVNGLIITNVKFESKWLKQNAKNQHESIRISISLAQELFNFQMIKFLAGKKAGTDKPTEIERFLVKLA